MRRELEIALRARATWVVAALAAMLVGHGFILAIDLFSASSRSAFGSILQAREMDPLAGIVRPTLGGVDLALVILGPLIAARPLAIEKERRTFGALCLADGSAGRVLARKALAALAACSLMLIAPVLLFALFGLVGGHLDGTETTVALTGSVLRMLLVVAVSVCAAAWTPTFAQAVTVGIAVSLSSWAIDAADGFAALSWLGGASAWSIERKLLPFQTGTLSLGSIAWLFTAVAAALAIAIVGASFEPSLQRKLGQGFVALLVGVVALVAERGIHRGYDWTEGRRASLPPAVVEGLRSIQGPVELDIFLDRDDSRRRQVESDVLRKLTLARSDVAIRTPLDDARDVAEGQRDAAYGRILIRTAGGARETRSTSRKEITTLVFEAAGLSLPDWNQPPYPGYPVVIEGARRSWLVTFAYFVIPFAILAVGLRLSHRRTR